MKRNAIFLIASGWIWLAGSSGSAEAQVVLNPNQITGTIRFSNTNPDVLAILGTPRFAGLTNVYVNAVSQAPAPVTVSSVRADSEDGLSTDYEITLEASAAGIVYTISGDARLDLGRGVYYFAPVDSAPLVSGGPAVDVDLSECASLFDIRFTHPDGTPAAVTGGEIKAFPVSAPSGYQAWTPQIPSGSTSEILAVRGGDSYRVEIIFETGADPFADKVRHFHQVEQEAVCDGIQIVTCVVPAIGSFGRITGEVDVLGEFEFRNGGVEGYSEYTQVKAAFGPFQNFRVDTIAGDNVTVPSSGAFELENLLPSDTVSPSLGYQVWATMQFRKGYRFEWFQTPGLGYGMNEPVQVAAGDTDLGNTFVINPSFIQSRIHLAGPAENPPASSLLRGLSRSADSDADADGIPDAVAIYGNYGSLVEVFGVDRLASGATLSASGGISVTSFEGAFNPAAASFEGECESVVGGLRGERSIWDPNLLFLTLSGGEPIHPEGYYYNVYSITDAAMAEYELGPGERATNDFRYCMSEVSIRFRSTAGTFHSPSVRFSNGSFKGSDFEGRAADYAVSVDAAFGTPADRASAANEGMVRMLLPQGDYVLRPRVSAINPNGTESETELPPFNLTVGCRQQIGVETCLQLNLNLPSCSQTQTVTLAGSVDSCEGNVTRISYRHNDGPEQNVCTDCGPDPKFSFDLALAGTCEDNDVVITAYSAVGGVSSVSGKIRFDDQPPQIQCPTDISVAASDTQGAIVTFAVTATDNCPEPATIVSSPPSGSVFPVGTTKVTSTARDACGNTSECSFNVTVGGGTGSDLTIERAVIVRWTGGGTLQYADKADGPWIDLPTAISPYCVPSAEAKTFYRLKQ